MRGLLLVLFWPDAVWRHLRESPLRPGRLIFRLAVPLTLAPVWSPPKGGSFPWWILIVVLLLIWTGFLDRPLSYLTNTVFKLLNLLTFFIPTGL